VLALIALHLPETRPADTVPVKGLPVRQYARILSERRFLSFAVVNSGAMGMALTYVSLAPNVLMGTAGLTPLQFSLVFGANGFWIMLVSFFANRIIHKVGRPVCLATGGMLMGLGCLGLLLGVMLLPATAQAHWLAYMLPVASACAGLAFVMGPATSYALGRRRAGFGGDGVAAATQALAGAGDAGRLPAGAACAAAQQAD